MKLLVAIATEPDLRALLVVGTTRTGDLGGDDLVGRAATRIRAAGTPLTTLELGALEKLVVVALLCEALRVEPEEAAPLAETIGKKTGGNPFFVRRFLGYLHAAGLLVYDPRTGRWSWDIARVEVAEATENVVDLLARSIGMLPAREQDVLQTAACVGKRVRARRARRCSRRGARRGLDRVVGTRARRTDRTGAVGPVFLGG